MRMVAKISGAVADARIKWLVIDEDCCDTEGYFLYYHQSLDEPSEYDSWHETKASAMAEAEAQAGVKPADWMETNN